MILRPDFLVALALATGVHVVLLGISAPFGGGGEGANGDAHLSITAASASIIAEVGKWEAAPKSVGLPNALTSDITSTTAPILPSAAPQPSRDAPSTLPGVETATFAPSTSAAPMQLHSLPAKLDPVPMLSALDHPTDRTSPRALAPLYASNAPSTPPALPGLAPRIAERPMSRPERSDPAVARVARDIGVGVTQGAAKAPTAANPSKAEKSRAQARWAATIQARIARKQRYPRGTRASGRVKVQMTVLASGALGKVGLVSSSGEAALDRAALHAVQRAAPFPPAPKELSEDWFAVSQWITFERR